MIGSYETNIQGVFEEPESNNGLYMLCSHFQPFMMLIASCELK